MKTLYLSRRNLQTLLNKLDRTAAGDISACSIIKHDTAHPEYPCSDVTQVFAIEDIAYYTDRMPGVIHPKDSP